MPPVEWIEPGYQGYGPPQLKLFLALGFDIRFGSFAFLPPLLFALAAPLLNGRQFCVLHPVVSILTAGFNLPVLRTLERTGQRTSHRGRRRVPPAVVRADRSDTLWDLGRGIRARHLRAGRLRP